jgi:hypothetical protein
LTGENGARQRANRENPKKAAQAAFIFAQKHK